MITAKCHSGPPEGIIDAQIQAAMFSLSRIQCVLDRMKDNLARERSVSAFRLADLALKCLAPRP